MLDCPLQPLHWRQLDDEDDDDGDDDDDDDGDDDDDNGNNLYPKKNGTDAKHCRRRFSFLHSGYFYHMILLLSWKLPIVAVGYYWISMHFF